MEELKWITQFSQLTASTVLTAILGWFLYHMPRHFAAERKSREVAATQYAKAAETASLSYTKSVEVVLSEAREQAKYEREMCERHHRESLEAAERRHREAMDLSEQRYREVIQRIEASHLLLRESNHTISNVAQADANRRAIEEMTRRRGRAPSKFGIDAPNEGEPPSGGKDPPTKLRDEGGSR